MKKLILISIIFIIIAFGCNKKNDNSCEEPIVCGSCNNILMGDPSIRYNCLVSSFLEASSCYSKCSNIYIIKGIALNSPYEYACNIRFIEDLKGNFPKNVNTFTIWKIDGSFSIENENKDEWILILCQSPDNPSWSNPDTQWFEKQGDYRTLICTSSILYLSDGYVNGHIFPSCGSERIDNISWKDFEKRLNKLLK